MKQETLEEFIKEELEDVFFTNISERKKAERLIELGAKWQMERYEEDMREAFKWGIMWDIISFEEWFEEFKNK